MARVHVYLWGTYTAMDKRLLLSSDEMHILLHRLACQLIENHNDFSNTVLIGIQPRGSLLSSRLAQLLQEEYAVHNLDHGLLDITFYRDDFRRSDKTFRASETRMDGIQVENKNVVFIDDVLYSGRSINAALTAILDYGRPAGIELLTLIDRRFSRHLPIQPNYRGRQVDSIDSQRVQVNWKEQDGADAVYLMDA